MPSDTFLKVLSISCCVLRDAITESVGADSVHRRDFDAVKADGWVVCTPHGWEIAIGVIEIGKGVKIALAENEGLTLDRRMPLRAGVESFVFAGSGRR
jgi:hypothetical protein